ncbi:MAG: hypothetical protein WDW36_000867 [Sanguina aurantia]
MDFMHKDLSLTGVNISDTDAVLLAFLKSYYCTVSALPATLRWDALESAVAASRLVLPFVEDFSPETGALSLGVPSNGDALADTVSELVRVAAAAVICRFHFHHHPSPPESHPSDEALLIFTSIGVRSCTEKANAVALTQQLEALQSRLPGGGDESSMSLPEIRWLMHYLRAEVLATYAQVQQLLDDQPRLQETLAARRGECLSLIKSVPSNPLGYILLCRSCLQLNQPQAALLFADKALTFCARLHAHHAVAQLQLIRATALALGGGRSASVPPAGSEAVAPSSPAGGGSSSGGAGVWTTAEVWGCVHGSEAAMQQQKASLPSVYHAMLGEALQPELRVVSHFVLGPAGSAAQSDAALSLAGLQLGDAGAAAASGVQLSVGDVCERPALKMLYTTPPVRSLPPGMLLQEEDTDEQGQQ